MAETIRCYDDAPYETTFTASVLSCEEIAGGHWSVVLDRTLFFPEEGGQEPDRGALTQGEATVSVTDVQIEDGVVRHITDGALAPGQSVTGRIDWAHRYDQMQQHTGEHILSGLTCARFGCNNVGFHLSEREVTMDYDRKLTPEEVQELERAANRVIADNLPVQAEYPAPEVLAEMTYRSKKALEGPVRIVTIPDVDCCACCAPHVRRTGEVGLLKVVSCQNYKSGVRLSIVCGGRALALFMEEHAMLRDLAEGLTISVDRIPAQVEKLRSENVALRAALSQARTEALELQVAGLPADCQEVLLFTPEGDMNVLRRVVDQLSKTKEGLCGIFAGSDDAGYSYILASGRELAQEAQQRLQAQYGAKGGGSPRMVQGRVSGVTAEALTSFLS